MKIHLLIIGALLASISLRAQDDNISRILRSIEKNNRTLQAKREGAEAQKLGNQSGIYLDNPELGSNYLWGSPDAIGNRIDFSVSQSFDMANLTGAKRKLAREQNSLVDWQYETGRQSLLLEAKQNCLDLIYYNALKKELLLRLDHAKDVAKASKLRLDKGDISILEYNKARLNLSSAIGEMTKVEAEQRALQAQLQMLNGGNKIELADQQYAAVMLPPNFDEWYAQAEAKNPALALVRQEVVVSEKQVALSKTSRLPSFSAGYMLEKEVDQHYQGVSLGLTIPLWQNKNQVKQAKAAVLSAELQEVDSRQQLYAQWQILYRRTQDLKTAADTYRESLQDANNTALLKKALDAGEISLLDYMLEIGLYYDTVNQALEAERDYQKAYAELSAVEL